MIPEEKSRKRSATLILTRTREIAGVTARVDLIIQEKGLLIGMSMIGGVKRYQTVMNRAGDMTDIIEIAVGATAGSHKGGVDTRKCLRDTAPRNRVIGAGARNLGRQKAGVEIIVPADRDEGIATEATARVDKINHPRSCTEN